MTHNSYKFAIALLFVILARGLLMIFYNDQILLGTTLLGAVITIVIYFYNKISLHDEELLLHDEKLFKQPQPNEDCPICMLPLPHLTSGWRYKSCCGKDICSGCIRAVQIRDGGLGLCPFCRTPTTPTPEGAIEQHNKRVEMKDAKAMYEMGNYYYHGSHGLPQDHAKALELWHRAAELGSAKPYYGIGVAYHVGNGVERDEKKSVHYWKLAAMGGNVEARHNLGSLEANAGNYDRALKHQMIAVGSGYSASLSAIQQMYKYREATKDDYIQALRTYQAYLGEIKSPQRDEASAAFEQYKYY
jgi:hypothetical protein